jgi:rubrerythrin
MSEMLLETITTVGEFLAHALELEVESAQRYREMADCLEVHNNPRVAKLFNKLADAGERHAEEVRQRAESHELPAIPPWDFKWCCAEGPESAAMEDVHYLMNKHEALELALQYETRGRVFYSQVATSSPNPEVRSIAADMAIEEGKHVEMLKAWLERIGDDLNASREDMDPPHTPE